MPFGPAANGSMFYHGDDGVIYAMDPVSGVSTPVVAGPDAYSFPLPSRDGQRIRREAERRRGRYERRHDQEQERGAGNHCRDYN